MDEYNGIAYPFYDEDTGVVYMAGKGESAVSFWQYNKASPNYLDYLHSFKGREP